MNIRKSINRLRHVQIYDWGYAKVIEKYQSPRTLLYLDPPYVGSETYYAVDDTPPFTMDDHLKLAALLNKTPAKVALSYYDDPLLEELYPSSRWRRLAWQTTKELSRMNKKLQVAHEVLLMNYDPSCSGLWDSAE